MLSKVVLSLSPLLLMEAEPWRCSKQEADGEVAEHESKVSALMMPVAAPTHSPLAGE